MSVLRASIVLVGDCYPDLTVGAMTCRRFAPNLPVAIPNIVDPHLNPLPEGEEENPAPNLYKSERRKLTRRVVEQESGVGGGPDEEC
jgi:hypothetical protein